LFIGFRIPKLFTLIGNLKLIKSILKWVFNLRSETRSEFIEVVGHRLNFSTFVLMYAFGIRLSIMLKFVRYFLSHYWAYRTRFLGSWSKHGKGELSLDQRSISSHKTCLLRSVAWSFEGMTALYWSLMHSGIIRMYILICISTLINICPQ
jgi:hypothetical protein